MRRFWIRTTLLMSAAIMTHACPTAAFSSESAPKRAEVLVLGVYHMANPGRDLFDTRADDVLAPKRQAEIAQVIKVLESFRPTKIAVEADPSNPRLTQEYADYRAGKYTLSRNEVDQIGYRLARAMGHSRVYGVDADGDFPWQRLVDYAKGIGRSGQLDSITADLGEMVKRQSQYLAGHSVLEALRYLNSDDRVAEDVGYYFREAHIGEPEDWPGADLVADWFQRNVRIYSNITHLVESPDERVLVIIGSGHLGWLRMAIAGDPTLRLRKLAELER